MIVEYRNGTPQTIESFWRYVKKTDTCWLWTGAKDACGYGMGHEKTPEGKWVTRRAHIISVRLSGREIPRGMQCDHLCDNPPCVRPDHIAITTQRMNVYRGTNVVAIHNKLTACRKGHPFTEDNTYATKRYTRSLARPERVCKTCHQARVAQYRKRKKHNGQNLSHNSRA